MTSYNRDFGGEGENIAVNYLKNKGYQIIGRNIRSRWGEIDIIVKKQHKLVFIEVKSRRNSTKGEPYEAITFFKKKSLKRAIQYYLLQNKYKDYKLSIDMVAVIFNQSTGLNDVKHYENIDTI